MENIIATVIGGIIGGMLGVVIIAIPSIIEENLVQKERRKMYEEMFANRDYGYEE